MPTKKKVDVPSKALDPRFLAVLKGLAKDKRYDETMDAYAEAQRSGGHGFGSGALRADGKIFAMIDSRGDFVVKLPKARVAALVAEGACTYFDAGKGKPMKEWLVVRNRKLSCLRLCKEAHAFVTGA
jgi:hypothetical protein